MRLALADHEPNKRNIDLRPAAPSEAANSKIARRHSVDGTPIMAWRDLIANLGTLTINEVELPTATGNKNTSQIAELAKSSD